MIKQMSGSNKQTGFTIVELIITIVLFAILVPSIASFLGFLSDINARSHNLALINSAAQNKIESLRSKGFIAVPTGTTDFTNSLPDSLSKPRSAKYVVTELNPSLKQVDLTISYNDHGSTDTYTYRSYLGELGVGQY